MKHIVKEVHVLIKSAYIKSGEDYKIRPTNYKLWCYNY